ncbi:Dystonin [Manis pentadactyla]|nr:Dystonin [Manis pentadactyla]
MIKKLAKGFSSVKSSFGKRLPVFPFPENLMSVLQGEAASQAQARQNELKKEAQSNKTLLDALNEVTSALLELVPWKAREGLEKMVAEDNDRYRLVRDAVTQKVEEMGAALLRSQQCCALESQKLMNMIAKRLPKKFLCGRAFMPEECIA